ncbi:MAG: class I SAM-dependent methyltransferase, partial [Hyphomicrobiales bacterium]
AWRLMLNPELEAGEAYMDGRMTFDGSSLEEAIHLIFANLGVFNFRFPFSAIMNPLGRIWRRIVQFNPMSRSRRNVKHHYDLSDTLYDLFLDKDRQYSCAYFLSPDDTIEQAQAQKKRHIAAKLLLKPGQKILDIGSGWGGLGLYLAEIAKADVTGLTLSDNQHAVSNARARDAGVSDRVRFKIADYRQETGQYDRIVSVGMFEHVGVNHFQTYFSKVAELLRDDGVALIHAIGRSDVPGHTNPWINRYIFPGGYAPSLSEVIPAIERARLCITDIEILRLHYAETLKRWRERFNENREIIRGIYDERFCRMWEFYLMTSEYSFRHGGQMVFQIQLAKSVDRVPITRDYITEFENSLIEGR